MIILEAPVRHIHTSEPIKTSPEPKIECDISTYVMTCTLFKPLVTKLVSSCESESQIMPDCQMVYTYIESMLAKIIDTICSTQQVSHLVSFNFILLMSNYSQKNLRISTFVVLIPLKQAQSNSSCLKLHLASQFLTEW